MRMYRLILPFFSTWEMFVFDPSFRLLEAVAVSVLCHLAVGQGEVLDFARVGFRRKQPLAFGPAKESYH